MGKTGEPIEGQPITVSFFHYSMNDFPIQWTGRSNNRGIIELGDLSQVSHIICTCAGSLSLVQAQFSLLKDDCSHLLMRSIRALENDRIQYVYPCENNLSQISRTDFSLIKQVQNISAQDCYNNLSLSKDGMHVYISGLTPGNYKLYRFSRGSIHQLDIFISAASSFEFVSAKKSLKIPDRKGRIFVSLEKSPTHPVTISNIQLTQTGEITVTVSGGSTKYRRVHVITRRFVPRYSTFSSFSSMCSALNQRTKSLHFASDFYSFPKKSRYVKQRRLGDEIVYCSDRNKSMKLSSNLLPVPSLIMNEIEVGITETIRLEAQEGEKIKSNQEPITQVTQTVINELSSAAPMASSLFGGSSTSYISAGVASSSIFGQASNSTPNSRPIESSHLDANLDFLSTPSSILTNLRE